MPNQDREAYNEYMREYMSRRYKERRDQVIERLGGKCARCSSTDDLQLDHKDPKIKSFPISRLINKSWKRCLEELAKCQLLCEKCHKKKTRQDALEFKTNMGENNVQSKLTEKRVLEARRRYKKGCRQNGCKQLAREFGVSDTTIFHAISGKTWKHVDG